MVIKKFQNNIVTHRGLQNYNIFNNPLTNDIFTFFGIDNYLGIGFTNPGIEFFSDFESTLALDKFDFLVENFNDPNYGLGVFNEQSGSGGVQWDDDTFPPLEFNINGYIFYILWDSLYVYISQGFNGIEINGILVDSDGIVLEPAEWVPIKDYLVDLNSSAPHNYTTNFNSVTFTSIGETQRLLL